jgi:hypothetical protein
MFIRSSENTAASIRQDSNFYLVDVINKIVAIINSNRLPTVAGTREFLRLKAII